MRPLLLYFVLVLLLVGGMLAVSYVLGQRHSDRATGAAYEAEIVSEDSARVRQSTRFYLIAMFFVVFDLEAVFLFSWAIAAREPGVDRLLGSVDIHSRSARGAEDIQIQKRAGRGHERSLINRRREERRSGSHDSYARLLLGVNVSDANIEAPTFHKRRSLFLSR